MKNRWFIGVDISKKTFDAAVFSQGKPSRSLHARFENTPSGYKNFKKWLTQHCVNLSEVFVCMEHTGIYGLGLASFIEGTVAYCIVNPLQVKRSMGIVRGKSDKVDAFMLARYCYLYREELKPTQLPSKTLQQLRVLFSERERIVKALQVEKAVLSELTPVLGERARQRLQGRMERLKEDLCSVEKELLETVQSDLSIARNYELATSVIGVGMVNAILFIIYSSNFVSITEPRSFACYSGIAPFEHSSGTSVRGKTRVSHLANKQIKTQLTNAARSAIVNDPELRRYYKRKRDEGKEHGVVMNAVKFKIVLRVYATIRRGKPFVTLRQAG